MKSQSVLQFRTGERSFDASWWRAAFHRHGIPIADDQDGPLVSTFVGSSAMSLIALRPHGSDFLDQHFARLASIVGETLDRPVPVERLEFVVGAQQDALLWDYQCAKLCAAKGGSAAWSAMADPNGLSQASRQVLKARVERDLQKMAHHWGLRLPEGFSTAFLSVGAPMPIQLTAPGLNGRTDKRPTMMARVHVRLIMNVRLTGHWFAGPLQGVGFGRLFRDGYAPSGEVPASVALELAGGSSE